MGLANYTDLVASIENWYTDQDLTAVIPDFITLVEGDLFYNKSIRLQAMEVTDTAFSVSARLTAFPTDFLEWRELRHSSSPYEKLDLVGADWANEHFSWITTGRPKRYLNEAGQLRMVPTPDTTYDLTVTYYAKLSALGPSQATNWILTNFPNVYLYGALCKSKGFVGNDERMPGWEAAYEQAVNGMVKADSRARWSGSTPAQRVRIAP